MFILPFIEKNSPFLTISPIFTLLSMFYSKAKDFEPKHPPKVYISHYWFLMLLIQYKLTRKMQKYIQFKLHKRLKLATLVIQHSNIFSLQSQLCKSYEQIKKTNQKQKIQTKHTFLQKTYEKISIFFLNIAFYFVQFSLNNNITELNKQQSTIMYGQSEAQQNLRNYSQQAEYPNNWFQNIDLVTPTIQKASSASKLTLMRNTFRNTTSYRKNGEPQTARQRQGAEKEQIKKSSLPQISFPILGGSSKAIEKCESTKKRKNPLACKLLHDANKIDRNFHSKFIQKMIQKQTVRIRISENNEEYRIKENNHNSKQSQESKGAFRNFKSLRKLKKTQFNGIRYTLKSNSQQYLRKGSNKMSLVDLFRKIQ